MIVGRKMMVVVHGIRSAGESAKYVVDMLIDGDEKSFSFEVRPHLLGVGPERAFTETFWGTRGHGARKIATLVINFHKGEPIDFPVSFEVIDHKPKEPSGGDEG